MLRQQVQHSTFAKSNVSSGRACNQYKYCGRRVIVVFPLFCNRLVKEERSMAVIKGTSGRDQLYGTASGDFFYGYEGNDYVYGDGGNDTLYGQGGDDYFSGGAGADNLYGDQGNDTASYADELFGDGGDNSLIGGAGNDSLRGRAGNDTLIGGAGADVLAGAAGYDIASYATSLYQGVTVDLADPTQNTGDASGDTYFSIEEIRGSIRKDILRGDGADSFLSGGGGFDTLVGWGGADILIGGDGNDTLQGGGGGDTLWGQAGDDTLVGGGGADLFSFLLSGSGADSIEDFTEGQDLIMFDNPIPDFGSLQISQNNLDTVINYGTGTIILKNVQASQIDANDFSFF